MHASSRRYVKDAEINDAIMSIRDTPVPPSLVARLIGGASVPGLAKVPGGEEESGGLYKDVRMICRLPSSVKNRFSEVINNII